MTHHTITHSLPMASNVAQHILDACGYGIGRTPATQQMIMATAYQQRAGAFSADVVVNGHAYRVTVSPVNTRTSNR